MLPEVALVRPLAGEAQGDGVGDIVGEIGEGGDAVDGRGGQGALQGAAAGAARDGDDGAVVAGAQVAVGIFDADCRLLGEGDTGGGGAGRLGLNDQLAGRAAVTVKRR